MKKSKFRELYYYIRDAERHPRITVCLIKDEEGKWSRGVSLGSLSEKVLSKIEGRKKAKKNARRAMNSKIVSMVINTDNAFRVIAYCNAMENFFIYKSDYNCHLTNFEQKIIASVEKTSNEKESI